MRHYAAAARIDAPVERVWSVLADLSNARIGAGIAQGIDIDYRGEFPVRTLHLLPELGGGSVSETIERLDPVARVLAYRVIDAGPVPMTHYRGAFTLRGHGGGTRLEYTAEFAALPGHLDALAAVAAGNFARFATNLAQMLGVAYALGAD